MDEAAGFVGCHVAGVLGVSIVGGGGNGGDTVLEVSRL